MKFSFRMLNKVVFEIKTFLYIAGGVVFLSMFVIYGGLFYKHIQEFFYGENVVIGSSESMHTVASIESLP